MSMVLELTMQPQPNDTTCGPTCLQSLYRYYGDKITLEQVVREVDMLEDGGTLEVLLAVHALNRGYKATIYTYNVEIFDPTWFGLGAQAISAKLEEQIQHKPHPKMVVASKAYQRFLSLGGKLKLEDLTSTLLRNYLKRGVPIITGLSATYLYRSARELGAECIDDDVRGLPLGHFVVLSGYDKDTREVTILDPYHTNPIATSRRYAVSLDRLKCAILLGVVTFDANLLIIEPAPTLKR